MTGSNLDALKHVIHDIELGAAHLGWDRPDGLFALVHTAQLLNTPGLPEDIAAGLASGWDHSNEHLSAVAQESVPGESLEETLPRLAWPDEVVGVAVSTERMIAPASVEKQAPAESKAAADFIANSPQHQDLRLVVGVLRSGETWCAVRSRSFDDDSMVGAEANLAPDLVEALQASLAPTSPVSTATDE